MSLNGSGKWVVAVLCSVLNFLHLGTARLSGSMYLAVLERYHVDRSRAALPFILCYTVRNVSGPLVGYLATKFGIYTVTMLGGLIAFIGIGCCYFAEDIIVVLLFWGIVFGFGFGMGSVLVPEILNQHFDKYVSNANGIAFGGECIAGFVLPIFLKYAINNYGLSGTFLILSSLMLNSIPATLFLKYLPHGRHSNNLQGLQSQENLIGGDRLNYSNNRLDIHSLDNEENDGSFEKPLLKKSQSIFNSLEIKYGSMKISNSRSGNEAKGDITSVEKTNRRFVDPEDSKTNLYSDVKQRNKQMNPRNIRNDTTIFQPEGAQSYQETVSNDTKSHLYSLPIRKSNQRKLSETILPGCFRTNYEQASIKYYGSLDQCNQPPAKNSSIELVVESFEKPSDAFSNNDNTATLANAPSPSSFTDKTTSPSSPFRIFLDPVFCMILLTQSTMLFNVTLLWTVIVDFCRDSGLSSKEEIYVLIFLSVLDMIGRLGLGWITDGGHVSNSTFSGVCCLGMGISVAALVFFRKVVTISCSVSIFGLSLGGFLIVCPGVVNDHIHKDMRGMALASRFFLFAPMSLSQSTLIGYFRGKLGSYNYIFIILAILCLFGSVTSLLTPYAEKYRKRSEKKNNGILGRNSKSIATTAGSVRQLTDDSLTKVERSFELTGKINRLIMEA